MRAFQVEMAWLAMGAIVSLVWRRGLRSHRQAIEDAEAGTSESPWMVTRMPAIVMVWEETGGEEELVP
jgi:hypothetical protein